MNGRLADMTFKEAETRRSRNPIVLLPIGATEAHGPHLPLATDCLIAEEMARRAATTLSSNGVETVIAPTIPYTPTGYAAGFAGSVTLPPKVFADYLKSICESLQSSGWKRICVVNAHLEPDHVAAIRSGLERLAHPVAFPDKTERRWAQTLTDEFKRGACHAGSYETSLLLAARTDAVRNEIRAKLPDVPIDLVKAMKGGARTFEEAGAKDAYFGTPALASQQEGEEVYWLLVEMVVAVCSETWPELMPLGD